jgi:hypothetical protein
MYLNTIESLSSSDWMKLGGTIDLVLYTTLTTLQPKVEIDYDFSPLDEISGNFDLLIYTKEERETMDIDLKLIPKPQLVVANGDINLTNIYKITSFVFTSKENGNGKVKYVVSPDRGTTWYTFKNGVFTTIPSLTTDIVGIEGMDTDTINTIPPSEWNNLVSNTKTIRFAYYLEILKETDEVLVDELVLNYETMGIWNSAIQGTDYDYSYINNEMLRVKLYSDGDYKINYYRLNKEIENSGELVWEEFSL